MAKPVKAVRGGACPPRIFQGGATPPQDIKNPENLYAYRLYHICIDILGAYLLYMLEPQYLAIYTCCDKVGLGAGCAESNLLVSLLSSLSHHAATV